MGKESETATVTLDLGEVHGRWLDFDNAVTEENGFPEDWADKCPCLQRGPYYVWPESALELATDNSKETP